MITQKYGIFTKEQHVEKIVNYLNLNTNIKYIISTNRWEIQCFDFDIGVSYCFPWLIELDAPENKNKVWYNFHPGPLPVYGNWGHYARAIKDINNGKISVYGATLHLIDKGIDSGQVLKIKYFDVNSNIINTQELGDITHYHMFQLFKETIEALQFKPRNKKELETVMSNG